MTRKEKFEAWKKERALRARKEKLTEYYRKHFRDYFGGYKSIDISPYRIWKYILPYEKELKPTYLLKATVETDEGMEFNISDEVMPLLRFLQNDEYFLLDHSGRIDDESNWVIISDTSNLDVLEEFLNARMANLSLIILSEIQQRFVVFWDSEPEVEIYLGRYVMDSGEAAFTFIESTR